MRCLCLLAVVVSGCAIGPARPDVARSTAWDAPPPSQASDQANDGTSSQDDLGDGPAPHCRAQSPEGPAGEDLPADPWDQEDLAPDARLPPGWTDSGEDIEALNPEVWRPLEFGQTPRGCFGNLVACGHGFCSKVKADYMDFYCPQNVARLGAGLMVGGLLANTTMDQNFRNWYQDNISTATSGDTGRTFDFPRVLGEGSVMIPVAAGAVLAGCVLDGSPLAGALGDWGQRSLRGLLVGWPPLLLVQWGTGGSRPGESPAGSDWKPFQDNNGASGHTFMGAVPFLVAADMTDRPVLKAGFYFLSTWAGIARINDDGHYLSQVLLGWWMAWLATDSVCRTELAARNIHVFPLVVRDAAGLGVEYQW